jgi:glycosyltransferase involved in cell wall biosynthesis
VLWTRPTGYVVAAWRALVDEGAEVLAFHRRLDDERPFDGRSLTAGLQAESWQGAPDVAAIDRALDGFDPDVLLVSSWNVGGYRQIGQRRRGRTLRALLMDNQWSGSLKQRGGVLLSRWVVRPTYDVAWVADERQAVFAGKLGFPAERLIWGMYSGDQPRFAAVARERGEALPPRAFLFVGRLVPDKAVDVLAAAYAGYRQAVADPWPLLVAGTGPQEPLLSDLEGVELLGFVQPDDLPGVLGRAGCFVLPSRFEPWGVVIHEAAAAGLPVVCTRACGASTRLVLDGYNGVVVSPGSADALRTGLLRIHRAGDDERRAMGLASERLARQYTPQRWARHLLDRVPELRAQVGLVPAPWREVAGAAR